MEVGGEIPKGLLDTATAGAATPGTTVGGRTPMYGGAQTPMYGGAATPMHDSCKNELSKLFICLRFRWCPHSSLRFDDSWLRGWSNSITSTILILGSGYDLDNAQNSKSNA